MSRDRGWRRFQRFCKMMRRLKSDWNMHYSDMECPCRVDPKVKSMFADTPQRCSCIGCGNRRTHGKGVARLSMQERRAPEVAERQLSLGRSRKYPRPEPTRKWRIQCRCGFFLRFSDTRPDWRENNRCQGCAEKLLMRRIG